MYTFLFLLIILISVKFRLNIIGIIMISRFYSMVYIFTLVASQDIQKEFSGTYNIKYISSKSTLPIELTDHTESPTTRWFKYGSQNYVDELPQFDKYYKFHKSKTNGNNLVFRKQEKRVFEDSEKAFLLDHYETQPDFEKPNFINQSKNNLKKIQEYVNYLYTIIICLKTVLEAMFIHLCSSIHSK